MRTFMILVVTALLVPHAAPAADMTVRSVGLVFIPGVVVAATGDTITLDNLDPLLPHTFTTEAKVCKGPQGSKIACDTGVVAPGSPKSVELKADPGVYDFFCRIHRGIGMVGRLVVQ